MNWVSESGRRDFRVLSGKKHTEMTKHHVFREKWAYVAGQQGSNVHWKWQGLGREKYV